MKTPIKVLVVDDSSVVRQTMTEVLSSDPDIQVIGTAADPYVAVEHIARQVPDVITLDVEMPRMDGLTFLQKLMNQHPIPVVIVSSLGVKGSETAWHALEFGAVEVIAKPRMGTKQFLEESRILICDAVKSAARARIRKHPPKMQSSPKLNADAILQITPGKAMAETTEKVIAVGASTGGTEAIQVFLQSLPQDAPGVIVVQHMPENFTRSFSERLNALCNITVKEAEDGDSVIRGRALIAPGNKHLLLKRSGARYLVEVKDGPLVSRHRPSVDVLFRSAARYAGRNSVGVIMTGMGDDGAHGMKEMKETGAYTIAQDEATCVVFGMPHEAIKLGGVDKVLPLQSISAEALRRAQ
jgi:two-component system, chemotaxis family, protein-glutamate methylesterase/glutaminase